MVNYAPHIISMVHVCLKLVYSVVQFHIRLADMDINHLVIEDPFQIQRSK